MSVLDNVALGAYLRTTSGVLASCLRLDRDEERRVRHLAAEQIRRVGLGDICTTPRRACRSASSGSSRSPARWPPIRAAAARRAGRGLALREKAGAREAAAAAAERRASASCWSSTTWIS
jgi:hypothetical protein